MLKTISVIYLFFVETKGRSLEELDQVFRAKDPVAESMQAGKVRSTPEDTDELDNLLQGDPCSED